MNAGCFGTEIKDILVSIQSVDKNGNVLTIPAKEINFEYRNNDLSESLIFLSASFFLPSEAWDNTLEATLSKKKAIRWFQKLKKET